MTVAPETMRATSWVRAWSSKRLTLILERPSVTRLSMRKCWSAKAAIWGRWVTQRTCWPRLRDLSFWPTASAARPPMPMSISSKTRVRGVGVFFLGFGSLALFDADLEGQHHAATFRRRRRSRSRGLRGSPGLVAMRYSTLSQPVAVQWEVFPSGAKAPPFLACLLSGLKP